MASSPSVGSSSNISGASCSSARAMARRRSSPPESCRPLHPASCSTRRLQAACAAQPAQHCPQRIVGGVWCRQKKIIAQRSAEQMHPLGHDADRFTQGRFAKTRQRNVVKPNLALLWVPRAREKLQKCRFSTSRTAKDRNALPGINRKGDVFQRCFAPACRRRK